jgi:hypothetical protein
MLHERDYEEDLMTALRRVLASHNAKEHPLYDAINLIVDDIAQKQEHGITGFANDPDVKSLLADLRKCDVTDLFADTTPTDTNAVEELRALGECIVGSVAPIELHRCMHITATSSLPDTLEFVNVESGVSHSYVRMDDIPHDVRDVVNALVSYRRILSILPEHHKQQVFLEERQQKAFVEAVNKLSFNVVRELNRRK